MAELDYITPPRENTTQRLAASLTPVAATALAAGVVGTGWIRVYAVSVDVDYKIGVSSMTTVVKDAPGAGPTVGATIVAGSYEDVFIASDTHVTYVGSGNGFLVIRKAGQKRTNPVT